ncbi:MAG: murein DD-endopeptidase MepM/ murein hydrolase activator NlpD [Bradymonadia bacterium]
MTRGCAVACLLALSPLLTLGCESTGLDRGAAVGDATATDADATNDAGPVDAAAMDAMADAALPEPTSPDPADIPQFAFPIHPDDRPLLRESLVLGVDHDPVRVDGVLCLDHDGRNFPFCYDGHDGTDYLLTGGFTAMDRGSARILAAAGGVVIYAEDGNYDRCRGSTAGDIDCDGNPMFANGVRIEHANGYVSWYWHMKRDSVAVQVGDVVSCGDLLGLVGSSGRSAQPHLHFEVAGPDGRVIDPYAGEFSQAESYWNQPPPSGDSPQDRVLPGPACHPAWTTAPWD